MTLTSSSKLFGLITATSKAREVRDLSRMDRMLTPRPGVLSRTPASKPVHTSVRKFESRSVSAVIQTPARKPGAPQAPPLLNSTTHSLHTSASARSVRSTNTPGRINRKLHEWVVRSVVLPIIEAAAEGGQQIEHARARQHEFETRLLKRAVFF